MRAVPAATLIAAHPVDAPFFRGAGKPYTRWWWLGGPYRDEDLVWQLRWVEEQGFGGVELAWLRPEWAGPSAQQGIPEWLGAEWIRLTTLTKRECDALGLGCDLTFGSVWPFGGRCVGPEDQSWTFDGPSRWKVHLSWEEVTPGEAPRILDHLSAPALRRYAAALAPAFAPALAGTRGALFCDSFEIEKRDLWGRELDAAFRERFGYDLREARARLGAEDPGLRYDHRRLLGEVMLEAFFDTFTEVCHELGAWSRVQCHGAPVDLLQAYARVDVPESEAVLFPPSFSRIPASAAALAGKRLVSCETFTCIYGLPSRQNLHPILLWKTELLCDLWLLADALFANGVNQIVWHGLPRNGPGDTHEFFASVHLGPDAPFAGELRAFNRYLETLSALLRLGQPCFRLAVYLPHEDGIVAGEPDDRTPGEQDLAEMRRYPVPRETEGFHPVWVSDGWLRDAVALDGGRLRVGALTVEALLVDVEWLDTAGLDALLRLARAGARVVLPRAPRAPGHRPRADHADRVVELRAQPSVVADLACARLEPLVEGTDLPPFWARALDDGALLLFFAHPATRDAAYPMTHGQGETAAACSRAVRVRHGARAIAIDLDFPARASLCVRVGADGSVTRVELGWRA